MAMADPTYEAWQIAPRRDLLTGEPLRDETPKMRVRVLNPSVGQRNDPVRYGPRDRNHASRLYAGVGGRGWRDMEPLIYAADAGDAAGEADGDADAE